MLTGANESFYPITHASQVIKADGSRLEQDGKINADKLGGRAPEYYIQARNLLDNSDFTNPVNQRNVTEWINVEYAYTVDRWQIWREDLQTVSAKLTGDGMQVIRSFYQNLSISPDRTYTFAAMIDGELYIVSGVPSQNPINSMVGMLKNENGTAQVWINPKYRVAGEKNVIVQWAALYEGEYTTETLPPYRPKGYAAELAECQRYYLPLSGTYNVFSPSASQMFYAMIDTPIEMYAGKNPTLGLTLNAYNYIYVSNGAMITSGTVTKINRSLNRGFVLHIDVGSASSAYLVGILEIDSSNSYISLDL